MLLLVADVEDLKADFDVPASGLIIEATSNRGAARGHALIEAGKLKRGGFIVAGSTYAKIRTLEATDGKTLTEAGPSTPLYHWL